MSETQCTDQVELFEVGRQRVTMTFDGGDLLARCHGCCTLSVNPNESWTNPDPREESDTSTFKPSRKSMKVFWILMIALLGLYIFLMQRAVH